jgi:hypothetical protein
MLKRVFVFLLCVSVFLPFLGSCGNPMDPLVRNSREDPEKPGDQTQSGETSDPDGAEDPGDGHSGEDPENDEDPDSGDIQDSESESDSGDTPDSGSEPGSEDGPEGKDEPDSGDKPASEGGPEDSPGSGDTPGAGAGQGDGGDTPSIGGGPVLTGIEAVKEYLDGQAENTPANPYHIKVGGVNLELGSAGDALKGLYLALSRYAALDLSGSYGEKIINVSLSSVPAKGKMTAIILPSGLTEVAMNAFEQCEELVLADLRGVTSIARGAFSRCYKLETLIADEVREITYDPPSSSANGAFHNCDSLVSVSLPKATEIGKRAFNSCDSLSTVYAPQAALIGDSAFAGCKLLAEITLGETPPELGESVFVKNKPDVIYVPAASVNTYKTTGVNGWTDELKAKVQAIP